MVKIVVLVTVRREIFGSGKSEIDGRATTARTLEASVDARAGETI